jgi:hypothetical protein
MLAISFTVSEIIKDFFNYKKGKENAAEIVRYF